MNGISKLAVGTAQFGSDYGISNRKGQCPPAEVARILDFAWAQGVVTLDTAPAYGAAETVLGQTMAGRAYRVVTKAGPDPAQDAGLGSVEALDRVFLRSLDRLGVGAVHGVMLRQADLLLGDHGPQVWAWLCAQRDRGRVTRIGVSVRDGAEIDNLLARYPIDIVQCPVSVLDQRLISGGQLDRMAEKGVEVHARSVFLQGLLLQAPDQLPLQLGGVAPPLARFHAAAAEAGLSPLAAALAFVTGLSQVNHVVVGCAALEEFTEIVDAVRRSPGWTHPPFSLDDPTLLDPWAWPQSLIHRGAGHALTA